MCWSVGKPGNGCFSPHRDYVPIMYKKTSTKLQVIWFVANWHCHNPTSFLKSSTLCPFIWQLFHWSIHRDYKPLCQRVGWSVGQSRICSINNNNNHTKSNRANPLPTGVMFFKIVNRWKSQESVEQHTSSNCIHAFTCLDNKSSGMRTTVLFLVIVLVLVLELH